MTLYGIVTELLWRFEGAELPSDTDRVIDRTSAGGVGAACRGARAAGDARTVSRSARGGGGRPGRRPAPRPVYADSASWTAALAAHVSISGISGVATLEEVRRNLETVADHPEAIAKQAQVAADRAR